ncbi:MAG TPA: pyrroloquinoline quinone-dependent dehydrogenase, partial [Chitinophagaceae bacterium]|nr:pyrroloquinoline quinone-dependent dehydrogenase [Chitinophagaceae bacterium]
MQKYFTLFGLLIVCFLFSCQANKNKTYTDWKVTGGSKQSIRYSSLTEIDTNNVSQLKVAWEYHTGDADTAKHSQIQCNPIIVDGIMYATSPRLKLIALDAATGNLKWAFDPDASNKNNSAFHFAVNNNRGVTYWEDKNDKRILYTAGAVLYEINANDGTIIPSFGNGGRIDLHDDLGRDVKDLYIAATSPGIIYKDLFILGSRVDEGPAAAPGHIRAYNVRTGKLEWIFHTIPQPGEFGYDTWEDSIAYKNIGGANCWSGFSLDEERGILFVPLGSASFDFYGGKRKGQNLFANCLLALDAATGKRIWHFQTMHHDVWDRDLPTPPQLITINKDGKKIDAVAQATKSGFVYVFERETGKPIYPVDEVAVDTNTAMPGEKLWPTQPIPRIPKPFVRQTFTTNDLNPYLPDSSLNKIKKDLQGYNYGNMFIPPGKKTLVVFPGFDGGTDWGGPSFDPETGYFYVNANEVCFLLTLVDVKPAPVNKETYLQAGMRLYTQNCMTCHGTDRKGSGNFPSIVDAARKYIRDSLLQLINSGRRMMPSFGRLDQEEKNAIASYVLDIKKEHRKIFMSPSRPVDTFRVIPYAMTGYYKFYSPEGYPAIAPPWGTITAINLNTGEHVWKTTLGEYPELKAKGIPPTGTENYGGSVVTAGGLLFIAAARDGKIRAFNKYN